MNRALSALGLARRAGKLNWGFAGVLAVCDRGFAEKLKQLIADGEREEMRI